MSVEQAGFERITPRYNGSHPVGEREAGWFHLACALVGVIHVVAGFAAIWYHGIAAKNHFDDC